MSKPREDDIKDEIQQHIEETMSGDFAEVPVIKYCGEGDDAHHYLVIWRTSHSVDGFDLLKEFYYTKPKPDSWRNEPTLRENGISRRVPSGKDAADFARDLAKGYARAANQFSGGIDSDAPPLYMGGATDGQKE